MMSHPPSVFPPTVPSSRPQPGRFTGSVTSGEAVKFAAPVQFGGTVHFDDGVSPVVFLEAWGPAAHDEYRHLAEAVKELPSEVKVLLNHRFIAGKSVEDTTKQDEAIISCPGSLGSPVRLIRWCKTMNRGESFWDNWGMSFKGFSAAAFRDEIFRVAKAMSRGKAVKPASHFGPHPILSSELARLHNRGYVA